VSHLAAGHAHPIQYPVRLKIPSKSCLSGWSHIGIIGALAEQRLYPDMISVTSIGSLVGAP
jgi:hypothetical protein